MRLSDFAALTQRCRESDYGFAEFLRQEAVLELHWPADVLEQWLYDHADNEAFLQDYGNLELSQMGWQVEAISTETFMAMPTGPSDTGAIEEFARDPEHWIAVRHQGPHLGVRLAWDTHGTWKRWPILLEQSLLTPLATGLQLVEGRTRVGVLRGRRRQGAVVAERHLAWVGRRT
ncbi:hypothetical protein [Kocuria sp. 2SI]|uniref:hypothetical protein n=1 Tax=Kocuria sp. 2SI TaxID=2502203 RepID=UPI0010F7E064|nr:hypothetical protein [Kocuria sp. 2SI]